jgi:spore germination protein KC
MRNKLCLIIIFLLGILLSGCSNYKELNEIALVVGIGIDYIPSKNLYEVVFQTINPSENTAKGAGSGGTAVTSYVTTGKTITEAAQNTTKIYSRSNIFSHIELVIIGEQLAKRESINFIFDVFERDAGVRVNVPVLIAREDQVKTVMDILPSNDKIPVRTLLGKVKNATKYTGEYGETKIYEVIEQLSNDGSEPSISGISVRGDKKKGTTKANLEDMQKAYVTLNGVAAFSEGRLVGWIDGEKTKSIQLLSNKLKITNLQIHCDEKRYNSVIMGSLKINSNVVMKNNEAAINIRINGYGQMTELLCNKDISKRNTLLEYEHKAENELKKQVVEGIIAAQKLKSDVFGFGEILHRSDPKNWNKYKSHWNDLFSQAKVNVAVEIDIEGSGMRIKPYPY